MLTQSIKDKLSADCVIRKRHAYMCCGLRELRFDEVFEYISNYYGYNSVFLNDEVQSALKTPCN